MNYKTREGGATVTVFVPYDCDNHCPFCINKQEYENCEGFSAEKICAGIDRLHAITPRCDFVFTGGEPLANPAVLQQLLDHVPEGHRVFINTTLPVQKAVAEEEIFAFLAEFRKTDPMTPIILVPTSYNAVTEEEFQKRGANIVIYANQLTRSGFPAMQKAAKTILENHRSLEADEFLMSIKEIIKLIPNE